jgi:hypothetical protein
MQKPTPESEEQEKYPIRKVTKTKAITKARKLEDRKKKG